MKKTLQEFAQKHRMYWWWVSDINHLSESALIEGTLNFGDFEDKKEIIRLIGPAKVKKEFHRMVYAPRSNIRPEVADYWRDYLNNYPHA
jgi:hypothetical protein